MSVFKACLEHARIYRPPADQCFSGVPGHGEGHASLADVAKVVIGVRPHIVVIASQMLARFTPARLTAKCSPIRSMLYLSNSREARETWPSGRSIRTFQVATFRPCRISR